MNQHHLNTLFCYISNSTSSWFFSVCYMLSHGSHASCQRFPSPVYLHLPAGLPCQCYSATPCVRLGGHPNLVSQVNQALTKPTDLPTYPHLVSSRLGRYATSGSPSFYASLVHQNGWSQIPFLSTVEYVRLGTYIWIQYLLPNMAIWTWGPLLSQTRARAWTTLHHLSTLADHQPFDHWFRCQIAFWNKI